MVGLVCLLVGCGADSEPGMETSAGSSSTVSTGNGSGNTPGDTADSGSSGVSGTTAAADGSTGEDDRGEGSDDSGTSGGPIELDCEGSVLADVVAGLPARSWATMPDNPSLDALEMGYSLLYWNDSATWDPGARRLQWVGGPGTCCANPAKYEMLAYEELTDTWTIEQTPFIGAGHAYDGNAMNPQTGEHFFALFNDPAVHRHVDDVWDTVPEIPFAAPTTTALTWFDALDGLVFVGAVGDVAWFDGASWTQLSLEGGAPWGTYNTFAEHSAPHDLVWVGGGNGGANINYVIDAAGQLTRGADAPLSLSNGQTLKSVDPISGRFLVGNPETSTWWEYDPAGDTWTMLDDMIDTPNMANHSVFHVPLPHCGVTLFFGHYWEQRQVWLYRHSPV